MVRDDQDVHPTDPTPHRHRAEHVGVEFDETVETCARMLEATPDLHYLAHYSNGVYDFSIDRLGDSGALSPHDRPTLSRAGRQLTAHLQHFDELLREPRTGALIRLVLESSHGTTVCNAMLPSVHLVAFTLEVLQDKASPTYLASDVVDRGLSELVTDLRNRIGLLSQNPGGFESLPSPSWPEGEHPVPRSWHLGGDERFAHAAALREACAEAVRADDLHFAAYCVDGTLVAWADQLDHPLLGPFFTQVAVHARRRFYQQFSRTINRHAASFNRTLNRPLDGTLTRMVFDVELGAIFSLRLGVGVHLVGVTLNQSRESATEIRLAALADRCEELTKD
ncbi:hypothetical protein [Umezawaea tangerina]|uniref:Uncharacterized protein n=1 Tax=Umezawaea tangerina TaxID=84725 RepID=A0A2T0SWQ9_9PSEU|nr:hypothetical protein [Umezawaea tangerina]PRY37829.1 hypothetical protein CLV43_10949 [Umezawaea tangerina]